jgi:hypothetical protein
LEGSLTFSLLISYTRKHTHTSQKATIAMGWERDGWMMTYPTTHAVLFIVKIEE